MKGINSERAKALIVERTLSKRFNDGEDHPCVRAETAALAVTIAETEAEERHAKELQELRDKAIITFKKYLTDYRGLSPTEKQYNEILECFLTELNK